MTRQIVSLAAGVSFVIAASSSAQLKVVTIPAPGYGTHRDPYSASASGQEPYLLRPGHYVMPGLYSPSYWSPHIRPFPDYSGLRHAPGAPEYSFGVSSIPSGGFGAPYYASPTTCGPYGGDVEAAYNQGRYDADHDYLWFIASHRAGRLINQSAAQFDEGIRLFHDGQYEKALVNWLGAAELNHDSAAPRLHAGHALFALGRFQDAVPLLARAFELQPILAYRTYDLRDEYGDRSEFDAQFTELCDYVGAHPHDAAGLTLLGYVTYFTRGSGAADALLRRAAKLDPTSYFIPKLLDVSRRAGPMIRSGRPGASRSVKKAKPRPPEDREDHPTVRVKALNG